MKVQSRQGWQQDNQHMDDDSTINTETATTQSAQKQQWHDQIRNKMTKTRTRTNQTAQGGQQHNQRREDNITTSTRKMNHSQHMDKRYHQHKDNDNKTSMESETTWTATGQQQNNKQRVCNNMTIKGTIWQNRYRYNNNTTSTETMTTPPTQRRHQ